MLKSLKQNLTTNLNLSLQSPSMNSPRTISLLIALFYAALVAPDPQSNLLSSACSEDLVGNRANFLENFNTTFSDIRAQLSVGNNRFAMAQNVGQSDPVFGVVQCRNYMSRSDCLQCFDAAEERMRNCSGIGAYLIYDGCIFRYEPSDVFGDTVYDGSQGMCGTKPRSQESSLTVDKLLSDLVVAAPRMDEYFATSIRQESGGIVIHAVAQCINIISADRCSQCLKVAYRNLATCKTFTEGRAVDIRCFIRFSDETFFISNKTTDITYFQSKGSNNMTTIIGSAVGSVGLFSVLVTMAILWHRNRKRKREELKGLMNYNYQELKSATSNFSKINKLGEGGFGDVYKATLKNGNVVAVKRLAITQFVKAKENFETELKLISNVHHRNLIRLLGGCSKRQELLLVYEYMTNSSLDKFLFGDKISTLNWKQRLDIIVGTAKGLAYLHEESVVCIIHRDIKASNILLDDNFQPKIADFGLARLLSDNQTHVNTQFAGTVGYMAPEYVLHGHLSTKVDTYSYGVVVLEIISGRKSIDIKLEPVAHYLVEWAWRLYEEDMVMNLVDKRLDPNQYDMVEVKKVIRMALLCTQSLVDSRPTMSDVLVRLS